LSFLRTKDAVDFKWLQKIISNLKSFDSSCRLAPTRHIWLLRNRSIPTMSTVSRATLECFCAHKSSCLVQSKCVGSVQRLKELREA